MFLGETSRRIQREMKLGTWNVRSLYRAGSLKAAERELASYKLQDGSPAGGMWVCGLDWAGTGQGQVADACECGNEPSGSIKMRGIS